MQLVMGKSPVLFGKKAHLLGELSVPTRDELWWDASLGRSRRRAMAMTTISCGRRQQAWRPGRLGKEKGCGDGAVARTAQDTQNAPWPKRAGGAEVV